MSVPVESGSQLIAHTVPSTWIGVEFVDPAAKGWNEKIIHRTKEPFRRIVSLTTPDGELTTPVDHASDDSERGYEAGDTHAEVLPFEGVLAERLAGFFDEYLSGKPRTAYSIYNCHTFGAWMKGLTDPDPFRHRLTVQQELPTFYVERGEREQRNLALGELGVIAYREYGDRATPLHSLIGLGENRDECLQVMWTNGYLGIASYDSLAQHYGGRTGGLLKHLRGVVDLGLYTLPHHETAVETEVLGEAA
jgi:hypothetical protein